MGATRPRPTAARGQGMAMLAAVLATLVCNLAYAPVRAPALTVDEVLDNMPFTAVDRQRIKGGEIVDATLPSSSERELAVAMAFWVKDPPTAMVRQFRKSIYRADPKVIGYGKIRGNGSLDDFKALTLGAHGSKEAKAFLNAAAGDDLNLSSGEIAAFAALKAKQPAAGDVQGPVEQELRSQLLARYRAYHTGGLAAVASYDRGGGRLLRPGQELADATAATAILAKFAPSFMQLLLGYPQGRPAQLDERFYWVVYDVDGRPTVALSHRVWGEGSEAAIVVDRLYYVSRSFNSEQAIGGFLAVPTGTMVVYGNRTSTDQVAGFGSSAKRAIGDHMMTNQISATFKKLQNGS